MNADIDLACSEDVVKLCAAVGSPWVVLGSLTLILDIGCVLYGAPSVWEAGT